MERQWWFCGHWRTGRNWVSLPELSEFYGTYREVVGSVVSENYERF